MSHQSRTFLHTHSVGNNPSPEDRPYTPTTIPNYGDQGRITGKVIMDCGGLSDTGLLIDHVTLTDWIISTVLCHLAVLVKDYANTEICNKKVLCQCFSLP